MTSICSVCKVVRLKVFSGQFASEGKRQRKVYLDHDKRRWRSNICPDCIKVVKRKSKIKIEASFGPEVDTDPLTTRKCRKCGKFLFTTRYFHCTSCVTEDNDVQDWGCGLANYKSKGLIGFKISDMNIVGAQ